MIPSHEIENHAFTSIAGLLVIFAGLLVLSYCILQQEVGQNM